MLNRLEETVHTLLPLRHQQTALIQSYEVKMHFETSNEQSLMVEPNRNEQLNRL